jgi:hypothetical protein
MSAAPIGKTQHLDAFFACTHPVPFAFVQAVSLVNHWSKVSPSAKAQKTGVDWHVHF